MMVTIPPRPVIHASLGASVALLVGLAVVAIAARPIHHAYLLFYFAQGVSAFMCP